jgi:Protein of unknown function (DUF2281).
MKEIVLSQFNRLPEHLQAEVLRFIQLLLRKTDKPTPKASTKKPVKLTFTDFHFPENGHTYSRSEIYGNDGR